MRAHEVYALRCHACDGAVELLANVDTYCPACLTWLDVQWRGVPVPPGSYWDVPGMNASAATSNCVPEDEETPPDPIHTESTSAPGVSMSARQHNGQLNAERAAKRGLL